MNIGNKIVGVVAVVALLVAGYSAFKPTNTQIVTAPIKTNDRAVLGASAGPDVASPYFSFGGSRQWAFVDNADASASTTCSFGPIVATTTLVRASAYFTQLATSTRAQIGVAATAFATTTSWGSGDIATGGGLLVASSSSQLHTVLVPGDYVNVKIGNGSTAGTLPNVGTCQLVTRDVI